MDKKTLLDNLQLALSASLDAGDAIMDIYNNEDDFGVESKADDSPLTKADLASHNCIVTYLDKTGIPVLSEEGKEMDYSERNNWSTLWIVDPIDGTKEFIKRNGEFTVNIALIENGAPIAGVVYAPAIDAIYLSAEGVGSYKLSAKNIPANLNDLINKSLKLPLTREDKTYTVVASRSHLSDETKDFINELEEKHGVVNSISKGSSLKICMVAEGTADCYPRFAPTMEWDTAAGHAIAKFADKSFIDWETKKEMVYNREKLLNNWFLVN